MNECIVCNKECLGRCCSGACRAKLSRITVQEKMQAAQSRGQQSARQAAAHAHVTERTDLGARQAQARPDVPVLTKLMLDGLPNGAVRPTGQPTARTRQISGPRLTRALVGVKDWQGTAEYAEVIYRLLTDELTGLNLPVWKEAERAA